MSHRDLLIEVGTEELPPKALKNLSEAFRDSVSQQLAELALEHDGIKIFASPRRLALLISSLAENAPDKSLEIWGPPVKVAFDDNGEATRAAQAFASKNGIAVESLKDCVANDGKQDKLCYRSLAKGASTANIVSELISQALASLPIPKRMRWGASRAEFVRPVHWLLVLFGEETLNCEPVPGLKSGNTTRGHRFHSQGELTLSKAADYENLLEQQGKVIADFQRRQDMIRNQVSAAGVALGGNAVIADDLLNEVTALVEWPVALSGSFEERFLKVPAEALISSMKEHQKYFHVEDKNGSLMPHFITVANIESSDPQKVIDGNERVIRPRLSDAAFFFETDCKTSLLKQREKLHKIVFQDKLGTVFEKTERVAKLAQLIALELGVDAEKATRAGLLCKSDLVTEMVGEFDDMQGIAGYYYARNDGEDESVALAMNEQYMPRFASDSLPESEVGTVLALADRLDTITGIFGIGQLPSGSKDPFALRRASLAVLRLIIEKNLALDLRPLVEQAIAQHPKVEASNALSEQILNYILERLKAWYEDQGIRGEVFLAVSAKGLSQPSDINARVHAVQSFAQLPEAEALAAANKRVSNILAKAETSTLSLDTALLQEPAEKSLADALAKQSQSVSPLFAEHRYEEALKGLAGLQQPVDQFFDQVMVNADNLEVRNNRLALLSQLQALFLQAADISRLVNKN
ncbi:glycyl-tRNA synthetase beta chain [Spongiibacter sp. IMCC21906]|uniref:glycine--tRNA ligase subunit beta n=1 Tax=Spongiibacter sp. IMCC21906 TaxID=1620392 RepID=UPI00062DD7A2|nr:glycine--tRNA ligase subunit beta [Spongiibacter sp. IMCC21906]AKH68128.1 glycyl-tRNA synthetase beta chain [Spongiibacter sp. IMCC21906]